MVVLLIVLDTYACDVIVLVVRAFACCLLLTFLLCLLLVLVLAARDSALAFAVFLLVLAT